MAQYKFTGLDRHLFGHGTHYEIYEKLGAHLSEENGQAGVYFAVWAPHAERVSVIGDFNGWDASKDVMKTGEAWDVHELFIAGVKAGDLYKYHIVSKNGKVIDKADPFAFSAQLRPNTASRVSNSDDYIWHDGKWMEQRDSFDAASSPVSVLELHPGSFMRKPDGSFNSYAQLSQLVPAYAKQTGYTHIELMGIAEHPLDASWGYQVTGYFAPTSRYGTPDEFKLFVDSMHSAGIGVILDWVPAHFPRDAYGLAEFDGAPLYEYADPRKGEHPDWGTKIFDYSKPEVKNFLISNALFWAEKYHIDGLRVDAVASMLYLDYGRRDGEWEPNKYGGRENLEAVEFLKHLNSVVRGKHPGFMMIAEESTAWKDVTADPKYGGLGFTLKWNMGFMHDFLEYISQDPLYRKYKHDRMTFGITYAGSENYISVLSHDEVVHLKKSMLEKIPGYDEDKFPALKAAYAFFIGYPGKKLLFMGQEFGQRREWSEERELDWYLLQEKPHRDLYEFWRGLLGIYRKFPALYENDRGWPAFEWINADDGDRSIFSFIRKSEDGKGSLVFVINFTPVEHPSYRVGVPCKGKYNLILSEKWSALDCAGSRISIKALPSECDGREYSIGFPLNAYGVSIFSFDMK